MSVSWDQPPNPRDRDEDFGRLEPAEPPQDALVVDLPTRPGNVPIEIGQPGSVPLVPKRIKEVSAAIRRSKDDKIQALRFGTLLEKGLTEQEAADELGVPLRNLTNKAEVKAVIKQLAEKYADFTPELDKQLVRMKRRQLLVEAEDPKVQLEAAKQIANDPEVGLGSNAPVVNIDMRGLPQPLLDMLDNTPED